MWKSLPKGSYALGVEMNCLFTQINVRFPTTALSYPPLVLAVLTQFWGKFSSSWHQRSPCFPQVAWREHASPNHWPAQPGSSERSLSCLLATPIPLQGAPGLHCPPLFENVCWREWPVWHGGDTSLRPSRVSGVVLRWRFSGACFFYIPSPL